MENYNRNSSSHSINLENRNKLVINGVSDAVSFDDLSVILDTSCGRLTVNGSELHILTLDLDGGNVVLEGHVDDLMYEDGLLNKKKGFFGRLVR